MSGVLVDPAPPAVAAAIEGNPVEYWRTCRCYLPDLGRYDGPDLTWFITGIPFAPLNQVILTRLESDQVQARIDATLALFRERGVPFLWSVSPSVRPRNLERYLEARTPARRSTMAGMAVDLRTVREAIPTPAGFAIERAGDEEGLAQWAQAYAAGFEMPELGARAFFDLYRRIGFAGELPFRHFVGFLDGEPVASSTLFAGAGVAGVYHVGTLPAARRQGIGAAMTLAALREGRDLGYRIGTLYASPMGRSLYLELGFQEHYTLVQYLWSAGREGEQ